MSESMRVVRRHWPLVVAVLLLAGAAVAFWQADRERNTDNVGNHAVVDAAATGEVQSAVASALVRVFSYDYNNPEPTQQAADDLLAGQAREQYDVLFAALEDKAPGQQLVLTAQVQVAAVQQLSDRAATLLVFLDQASQRASDQESAVSAAQLSVRAAKSGGDWRITGIEPL